MHLLDSASCFNNNLSSDLSFIYLESVSEAKV